MTNHDPRPWVYQDGERWAKPSPTDDEQPKFDPRPEYETDDPQPWIAWGVRYATPVSPACYFEPRDQSEKTG